MVLLLPVSISSCVTSGLVCPYGGGRGAVAVQIISRACRSLAVDCGEEIAQGRKGCGFPVVATRVTPSLLRLSVSA